VLDEGFVIRSSDIDVASVLGYGFPSFRGGVYFYGETIGFDKVYSRLQYYADTFGANNSTIRAFFQPCQKLKKLAQN